MTSLENLRSIWRVGCLMWRGRNTYCGLPDCADGEVDSGVIFRGLVQTPRQGWAANSCRQLRLGLTRQIAFPEIRVPWILN